MDGLGPHAVFIAAAYASVVLVLSGLIAWILLDARRQERMLAELEAKGIRRRSARKPEARAAKGKGT